jgi:hypothetical protein
LGGPGSKAGPWCSTNHQCLPHAARRGLQRLRADAWCIIACKHDHANHRGGGCTERPFTAWSWAEATRAVAWPYSKNALLSPQVTTVATAPRNRTHLCPDSVCGRGLPIYTCFVLGSSTESVRGGQVHLGKRQQVACAGEAVHNRFMQRGVQEAVTRIHVRAGLHQGHQYIHEAESCSVVGRSPLVIPTNVDMSPQRNSCDTTHAGVQTREMGAGTGHGHKGKVAASAGRAHVLGLPHSTRRASSPRGRCSTSHRTVTGASPGQPGNGLAGAGGRPPNMREGGVEIIADLHRRAE